MHKSLKESRLALYKQGYSDYTIAHLLGFYHGSVYRWRKREGLPANYKGSRRLTDAQET